ncbi:hypothetical protein ACFSQP_03930 [Bizionia sediminis]|uniref:DUF3955 domain-containing protein n=1 Tax=Bizionia sediminis TaxID=1737064 RepID=A0ABW5KT69_9FLAO
MTKFHIISAIIAAIAFMGFVLAHDYYTNSIGGIEKYVFQFIFFAGGLLVFDYVLFRRRKK